MDLEDPASNSEASLSTSSSSSTSASSFSSLFAFFDPSSSPALFSSSSSASHSSAASAVKWVDRSGSKNWDSPMWQLGLFMCSEHKEVNRKYLVKCVVCEQHHSSFVRQYNGSKPFLEHAESSHPKEAKVAEWIVSASDARSLHDGEA